MHDIELKQMIRIWADDLKKNLKNIKQRKVVTSLSDDSTVEDKEKYSLYLLLKHSRAEINH